MSVTRNTIRILLAALFVGALFTFHPSSASANNDPFRTFLPASPLVLTNNCSFPVMVTAPKDREYATITPLAGGSLMLHITGQLISTVTNMTTSKSITVTTSGPGDVVANPDGSFSQHSTGVNLSTAVNATSFGYPSNLLVVAGPTATSASINPDGSVTVLAWTERPAVLLDVCAALS